MRTNRSFRPAAVLLALVLLAIPVVTFAEGQQEAAAPSLYPNDNWNQYRSDANRSGYTENTLSDDLGLRWMLKAGEPSPAWTGVHTRMIFDYAYHPVVNGNMMYYGSSADHQVHAVNVATGEEVWTFFTDAPVRFSPVVWRDRVFANSDDGRLYCLKAGTGELLWSKEPRAAIHKLGDGNMVSNWPSRGGIALQDNVLYYGVGIWPTDGIDIYALNPSDGSVIWHNGEEGERWTKLPHGQAEAFSGISSQGYIVVTDDHVIVPTGRAIPAALDKRTGKLDYYHYQDYRSYGGSRLSATNDFVFVTSGNTRDYEEIIGLQNGIFNEDDGRRTTSNQLNSPGLAFDNRYLYSVDPVTLSLRAFELRNLVYSKKEKDRQGNDITVNYMNDPAWILPTFEKAHTLSIIKAGDKIVAATANEKVTVYNADSKAPEWSTDVDGVPYGLAVAQGKLFVSTDQGYIYCFDNTSQFGKSRIVSKMIDADPYGDNDFYKTAAREILDKSEIAEGYCLDVECGDGALAYELIKISNLFVVAVDSNPATVAEARAKLDAAGVYGSRVVVQLSDPDLKSYPSYFANLVVSAEAVETGRTPFTTRSLHVQRPEGGAVVTGKAGAMRVAQRGELDGAGEWTQMYADAGNTICSMDEIVEGDLGILWWNDPDFDVPSRHGRGVAPLYKDGMMFMQGVHGIRAYDAYNGRMIWDYYIEDLAKHYDQDNLLGAAITGANYAIDGDKMFIRVGMQQYNKAFRQVHVVDIHTGNRINILTSPKIDDPAASKWGPLNYWGVVYAHEGTLYGTIANVDHIVTGGYREADMSHQYSESLAVFAMDPDTGDVKWMYEAEDSIRHNTIAIGDGMIYFIDRPLASQDRLRHPSDEKYLEPGTLMALDLETGRERFSVTNDYATLVAVSAKHDVLIATQQYTRFKLPSEIGGKITAYRASTGRVLWEKEINIGENRQEYTQFTALENYPDGIEDPRYVYPYLDGNNRYKYASRPLIIDDEIFFEPFSFELLTGRDIYRPFARTYNCGILCAGAHMITMRSGVFGYFEPDNWEAGVRNWGGFRPACWIHTIVAGGLVMVPEGQARCDCSYLMLPSLVLAPRHTLSPNEQRFSFPEPAVAVK